MSATTWPFIEFDDRARPRLAGSCWHVSQLLREHIEFRWDAEQIARQHPDLTLPQIHAALGYYYDHREECDRLLVDEERELAELRAATANREIQERMSRLKSLR